jgi:hypothetical protein
VSDLKREAAKKRSIKRIVSEVWAKVETGEVKIVAQTPPNPEEHERLHREFLQREESEGDLINVIDYPDSAEK